jgi:hypothetical protein
VSLRQQTLIVAEAVAADALARGVGLQGAARPAELARLVFRDEIPGQVAVAVQIQRDVLRRE